MIIVHSFSLISIPYLLYGDNKKFEIEGTPTLPDFYIDGIVRKFSLLINMNCFNFVDFVIVFIFFIIDLSELIFSNAFSIALFIT